MNDMLKDVFQFGTAAKARSLGFTRPFAGKTGTTSNYHDAWFIGYSPRILSLVWVGFDDNHSIRLAGGEACVPIWTQHMNRIAGLVPDVDWKRPEDVVDREIDPQSGMLATPFCPQTRNEIFVSGTEPSSVCPLHAGSGEPIPFFREDTMQQMNTERAEGQMRPDEMARPQAVPQQRPEERRPARGIRGLLRRIFGGGQ
jgi:membrane carboxypeptidase/penicillin-binding protein